MATGQTCSDVTELSDFSGWIEPPGDLATAERVLRRLSERLDRKDA